MANFGFMLAAFSLIWIVLFVYVFVLFQRQSRLRREIEQLKAMLPKETK